MRSITLTSKALEEAWRREVEGRPLVSAAAVHALLEANPAHGRQRDELTDERDLPEEAVLRFSNEKATSRESMSVALLMQAW